MEKITLKFSARHCLKPLFCLVVLLELDDNGKQYSIKNESRFELEGTIPEFEGNPELPKQILESFTESAIHEILSKDEIPNKLGTAILDGPSYEITISQGNTCKKYHADDANIDTYPLLRHLASWFRKQ